MKLERSIYILLIVLCVLIINYKDVQIEKLKDTVSICYDSIDMTNKAESKNTDDFIHIDLSETKPTAEELKLTKEMRDSYNLIISKQVIN